ncbi:hypothetical protein [Ottowia sp.]|uniref:hypothetical protein n=1 Tax=Ottowia sp. TaxID=1898956 RepID=UPI002BE7523D|nr:hypothetical protein [Pseudomonadota bacterium]HOV17789.1 hypothetical protein [Ottowia sp.]
MRSFDDPQGRRWQAALLEASYGNVMLVLSPMDGAEVVQHLLDADNLADAEVEIAALDDDALRALLVQAKPWDHQAGVERARAVYGSGAKPGAPASSFNRRKGEP